MVIFTRCHECGQYHDLSVIRLFSNFRTGRCLVICWNKFKVFNLYYTPRNKNSGVVNSKSK